MKTISTLCSKIRQSTLQVSFTVRLCKLLLLYISRFVCQMHSRNKPGTVLLLNILMVQIEQSVKLHCRGGAYVAAGPHLSFIMLLREITSVSVN